MSWIQNRRRVTVALFISFVVMALVLIGATLGADTFGGDTFGPPNSSIEAELVLQRFDAAARTVTVHLKVYPKRDDKGNLEDSELWFHYPDTAKVSLLPGSVVVTPYYTDLPEGSLAPREISLADFRSGGFDFSLDFPTRGNNEDYPNDAYEADYTFQLAVDVPGVGQEQLPRPTVLTYYWMRHYVGTVTDESSGLAKDNTTVVFIEVSRPIAAWVFVWVVSLSPLLLLGALVLTHFDGHQVKPLSLEFGAAILAILPLRLVLVPMNLEGLTRIDLVLGAQLVILIGAAAATQLLATPAPESSGTSRITAKAGSIRQASSREQVVRNPSKAVQGHRGSGPEETQPELHSKPPEGYEGPLSPGLPGIR